jgi:prepilin-type N-terminal cleavage/methylation domain-containing protein
MSRRRAGGFTLLELVIAVTILASFLLPLMLIVSRSKVKAIKFTQARELRDLAQRKLFDRIHYYEERDQGDFAAEGHTSWTWEVAPPEMVGNGEQPLLEYTIRVRVPQEIEGYSAGAGEGSTFELQLWTFPDERWYEEQQYLYDQGQYSPLFGAPGMNY